MKYFVFFKQLSENLRENLQIQSEIQKNISNTKYFLDHP